MSERQKRLLFFLYSTPNIVGALLGLAGLLLFFTGVIQQFWFFIVVGVYAAGCLVTPKNRPIDLHLKSQLDAAEIRGELEGLVASVKNRVSKEVLGRVTSIQSSRCYLPFPAARTLTTPTSSNKPRSSTYRKRSRLTSTCPQLLPDYIPSKTAKRRSNCFWVNSSCSTPRLKTSRLTFTATILTDS